MSHNETDSLLLVFFPNGIARAPLLSSRQRESVVHALSRLFRRLDLGVLPRLGVPVGVAHA